MSNYNDLFAKPAKQTAKKSSPQKNVNAVDISTSNNMNVVNGFTSSIKTPPMPTQAQTLPDLKDSSGRVVPLDVIEITSLGSDASKNISALSENILKKVKSADTGLGDGINQILTLTQSVDISKLGNKERDGFFGKLLSFGRSTRNKVLAEFQTVSDQVENIANTLGDGVKRMRSETDWLQKSYDENIAYLRELEHVRDNVQVVLDAAEEQLQQLASDPNVDVELINKQRVIANALSKQHDKLLRLIHIAKLTAPQISSMQVVNQNTIEKFESLRSVVIPLWKQQMSMALVSEQQQKDNMLSNQIDDATNRLFAENTQMIGQNMVESAKANQRSVIDLGTLQKAQTDTLNAIKQCMDIERKGKEDRRQAALQLEQMDNDLQKEMRGISDQANNMYK